MNYMWKTTGENNSLLQRGLTNGPKSGVRSSLNNLSAKKNARYFPLGLGKHTCLEQPYASWLTMTITSTIFNNFDMKIEDLECLLDEECSFQRIKDHVYAFPKLLSRLQFPKLLSRLQLLLWMKNFMTKLQD